MVYMYVRMYCIPCHTSRIILYRQTAKRNYRFIKTWIQWCNYVTVKLRKPWTPEKFQGCWLCTDLYWPITIKLRIRKQTSKPQINDCCCLWFSYLVPCWLISRNTIAFHKYFWCSGFCEFHNTLLFSIINSPFLLRPWCTLFTPLHKKIVCIGENGHLNLSLIGKNGQVKFWG